MSRIPGWSQPGPREPSSPVSFTSDSPEVDLRVETVVPGALVDTAVAEVIAEQGHDLEHADRLQFLMRTDGASAVMTRFHQANMAAMDSNREFFRAGRPALTVPMRLDEKQRSVLSQYAPEFDLKFVAGEHHDHAMAAAARRVDRAVVMSHVPPSGKILDIGGDPLWHAANGRLNVHCCTPLTDQKDASRRVMRRLALKKMSKDAEKSLPVRQYAERCLASDVELLCEQPSQLCAVRANVVTMIHVYDVPITDLAAIMVNKGASVLEGAMLFSNKFFAENKGTLDAAGAVYEIDIEADVLKMGFSGSAAWWYQHKWSQLAHYGVDQILASGNKLFSYKVVERRGDTIFFRVLPAQASTPHMFRQQLRLPGVPAAVVHGFKYRGSPDNKRQPLVPHDWQFPPDLWCDLVRLAQLDYEQGKLSFDKLFDHYRTVSPRNTINARLISGGDTVEQDAVGYLVVHAGVYAAQLCTRGRMETAAVIRYEQSSRLLSAGTVASVFIAACKSIFGASASWLTKPVRSLLSVFLSAFEKDKSVSWELAADYRQVSLSSLNLAYAAGSDPEPPDVTSWLHDAAIALTESDAIRSIEASPAVLKTVLSVKDVLPPDLRSRVEELSDTLANDESDDVDTPKLTSAPFPKSAVPVSTVKGESSSSRYQAAVVEAVHENDVEHKALLALASRVYSVVCPNGKPAREMLLRHADDFYEPDLWRVDRGVICESVLQNSISSFSYSGAYAPVGGSTGQIHHVEDASWERSSTDSEYNAHHKLKDIAYTGYVLTMSRLVVYNGPDIRESLKAALDLQPKYSTKLVNGPPGCGKSYLIKKRFAELISAYGLDSVVILCPAKESANSMLREIRAESGFSVPRTSVSTLDSYLVNARVPSRAKLKPQWLLGDEVFMAREGKWCAAVALLGALNIEVYGDPNQIPHVPRVDVPEQYVKMSYDTVEHLWITYRCPGDATAAIAATYNYKIRTRNQIRSSMTSHLARKSLESPPAGCVMLCMYQAEKKELEKSYAVELKNDSSLQVLTTHEAEGKTYSHVWLHRLDVRPREDNTSLYDRANYALVAVSRHTTSFKYIRPRRMNDRIDSYFDIISDKRRVDAVYHLESAGTTREID